MQNNTLFPYTYEFRILSDGRKTTREFRELTLWPDGSKPVAVTAREYWLLSDLLKTVRGNYSTQYLKNTFALDRIIRKNTPKKVNLSESPLNAHIHVKMQGVNLADIELSRYACWTLMKEIGKTVPTVFQQEYFLNPNTKLGDICASLREPGRVYLRAKGTQLEKQLHGILNRFITKSTPTHLKSKYHSELNSYTARCLYGNAYTNVRDIKESHNIPLEDSLSDYMNFDLLSAYCNALENIIAIWDTKTSQRTYESLRQVIYNEMTQARTLFNKGRPEQNFSKTPVSQIQQLQDNRELEFAKQYVNIKVH